MTKGSRPHWSSSCFLTIYHDYDSSTYSSPSVIDRRQQKRQTTLVKDRYYSSTAKRNQDIITMYKSQFYFKSSIYVKDIENYPYL